MATASFKQDMPPSGGYNPINYKRVPAKSYFGGWTAIGIYVATTAVASYLYYLNAKRMHHEEVEERSTRFALQPMLLAERDRNLLKQLRKNREDEAKLMANVEGWQVGTYYGEPVFHDYKIGKLHEPSIDEYFVHTSEKNLNKRKYMEMWT